MGNKGMKSSDQVNRITQSFLNQISPEEIYKLVDRFIKFKTQKVLLPKHLK